jgi:hypothetical protein
MTGRSLRKKFDAEAYIEQNGGARNCGQSGESL